MTNIRTNVGGAERILSIIAGAYLLYDAIIKRKANAVQTMSGSYLMLRGITGFCLAYQGIGKTAVDFRPQNINIRTSVTVSRPRDQVYGVWRRLENLPQFMKHLESVQVLNDNISEWKAIIPGHLGTLTWRSEIVKDDPGILLGWQSLPGSSIENAGKVTFKDAGMSGTEIQAVISYHAPLGIVGEKTIRLFNPIFEKMVEQDIQNFKQYIEADRLSPITGRSSEGNQILN